MIKIKYHTQKSTTTHPSLDASIPDRPASNLAAWPLMPSYHKFSMAFRWCYYLRGAIDWSLCRWRYLPCKCRRCWIQLSLFWCPTRRLICPSPHWKIRYGRKGSISGKTLCCYVHPYNQFINRLVCPSIMLQTSDAPYLQQIHNAVHRYWFRNRAKIIHT